MENNLKLILGLIWTLILHYQISIGFGIGDDKGQGGTSPKQALMAYLRVCEPRTIGYRALDCMTLCTGNVVGVDVVCQTEAANSSHGLFANLLTNTHTPTQGLIPDKNVKNLTKDWNDGILIAAVVDAVAPGLCPECADMRPENAVENAFSAMKLAEDWLGVPMVSCRSH